MPEVEDFLPLFPEETEATVLGRMLTWLNDGVDISDPTWIDPREGGIARTLLVPSAREMAVLYDRISVEFPAAASPLFAWGYYLDQWAIALGAQRLAATAADGIVRFTGPDGVLIPAGTEVGADPNVSEDAPSYVTQADQTITGGFADAHAVASETGLIGNAPTHAITAVLSSLSDPTVTVDNPTAMQGGTDEESDEALRERVLAIYSSVPGGGNVTDYIGWVRSVPGVGGVSVTPEVSGPGTVGILATTPDGGPVSDAVRLAIRNYLDPPAVDSAASAAAASTITVASTSGFRAVGIVHMGQPDLSTERIYNYTAVTATQFTGVTPAPTFTAGDHVWQTGRGGGRSPVGHHVIVGAAVGLMVTITATLELRTGYSLDGGVDVAVRGAVEDAIRDYIDLLQAGQEIVLRRVEAAILDVEGVYDIGGTQINGVAQNFLTPVSSVPTFQTAVLTAGSIT